MTQDWKSISNDPNAPAAQKARRTTLVQARSRELIVDREGYLAQLAAGLNVLDVGVVAHTPEAYESPAWLHRRIAQSAKTCTGVDILEREVQQLRSLGFNVLCRDICTQPLEQTFDLIVCGELIEHLDAPGPLFAGCAKMLEPGGRMVLSTPNPWFLTYALKGLFECAPLVDSADHVAWFDPATLCELGMRHGFRLDRYTGVRVTKTYTGKAGLLFALSGVLMRLGMRRETFAKTVVYEFVKA